MKTQRGFSLVELAIVLVIIGLIVGGILTGQDLIRASELNSLISEKNKYQTAINTFKLKYNGLPGDIKNATSYWGTSANCPGTSAQGTTDGSTCNGNGDGRVNTGVWSIPTGSNESYRMWQHLASAGLIDGVYDGVTAGAQVYSADNTNSPEASIPGNVIWLAWYWSFGGDTNFYSNTARPSNTFIIGGVNTGSWNQNGFLSPADAYSIDGKIDDGISGMGLITAVKRTTCTLSSNATDYTAGYDLADTSTTACALMVHNAF